MKKILLLLFVFIGSCATISKMTNEAFYYALVGQNEMKVFEGISKQGRDLYQIRTEFNPERTGNVL